MKLRINWVGSGAVSPSFFYLCRWTWDGFGPAKRRVDYVESSKYIPCYKLWLRYSTRVSVSTSLKYVLLKGSEETTVENKNVCG